LTVSDWTRLATPGRYTVSDFRFDDGRSLDLTLAYHTLGTLDADAGNAVMLLHGTIGSGRQFLQPSIADVLFASGQPLDVTKYFVILPDAIGHGASSRPSHGLGPDFPRYGYGDIVTAQHRLLVDGLGIERLRLLLGTSMGGMQTWMWGQRYPERAHALMAIASLPERITGRNLLWRRMLIHLIESDPGYAGGRYDVQPAGLGHAMALFSLMVGSPRLMASELGSVEAADAPILAVNFEDDGLNPAELGGLEHAIAQVPHGRAVMLPVGPLSRGHQTLHVAETWRDHLADLLAETGTVG